MYQLELVITYEPQSEPMCCSIEGENMTRMKADINEMIEKMSKTNDVCGDMTVEMNMTENQTSVETDTFKVHVSTDYKVTKRA